MGEMLAAKAGSRSSRRNGILLSSGSGTCKKGNALGMNATITELRAWRAAGTTLSSVKCVNESNVMLPHKNFRLDNVHKEEKSLIQSHDSCFRP